jgi:ribosomal protein L24
MKVHDRVVIIFGRLKGETGWVIGFSDLNMEHKIIVHRDNQRAREPVMGFNKDELTLKGK